MRKFFLIPLLSVLCTAMAFATVHTASTFAELQSALAAAANGDEIQLTADIAYPKNGEGLINITKSITLDGQGHKISGYGDNGGRPNVIAINNNNPSYVTVELKNLEIYSTQYRPLETRGYITKLTLDNVNITSTGGTYNPQGLTIGGSQASAPYAQLVIKDSKINATKSGYPVLFWNPTIVTATNSDFSGYCGLYFKTDSKNSVVNADACNFDAPNVHSGASNAFAVFAMEDAPLTFVLNNCGMNAEQIGDQKQPIFCFSEYMLDENRTGLVNITLSGDNTHINCQSEWIDNSFWWSNPSGTPNYGSNYAPTITTAEAAVHINVNVQITGGTYSVDPREMVYGNDMYKDEDYHYNLEHITIPEGYEVKEIAMEGVATSLYRVVKKAEEKAPGVKYDLNDDVPTDEPGAGNNPVSSFDLSNGEEMTLNQETTTAGYVEIKDHATEGATTVTVRSDVALDPSKPEEKTNQTLVINNGLDVQGDSKVIVEAGATLQIGEGGIVTAKPENIVIEANENGAASLIMDPAITVNQTPNLTVEMKVSKAGKDGYGDYWWHRFAMPVGGLASAWLKVPNYGTYLYGWNYTTNDWEALPGGSTSMQPWTGYTLTYNEAYNEDEIVTYTFQGNLVGNTNASLDFKAEGYQFFGNSYTGYIDVLTLINELTDGNIDKSVWMWNPENQTYTAVPLDKLSDPVKSGRLKKWQREVAPMQTFIMRLRGSDSANETVNYASAIWGNPRYGHTTSAPAPRRLVAGSEDEAYMEIVVTAANGQSDRVDFTVNADRNDAFENGYDASKYMNERHINLYAAIDGEEYTSVATNAIEGKTINLQTRNDVNYTISFENVEGEEYALLDKATNKVIAIEEGTTYEFAAQPNSTVEGRFEVVRAPQVLTGIENAEVKANAKGIYSMTGIYMGEDFKALPAGVYVVDGVKIVK